MEMRTAGRAKVVIGFADSLAAPEVVWSLQAAGFETIAFARAGSRPSLRYLQAVELRWITAPEQDAHRSAAELRTLVTSEQPLTVMPLDDASIWLIEAGALHELVPVAGPTGERVEVALDKRRQLDCARQVGLEVPATDVYDLGPDLLAFDRYPCVLKPALAIEHRQGRLVRNSVRICANPHELERAVGGLRTSEPVLVQELVRGRGEGVFGFAHHGRVAALSAHRRVRMMDPEGSGSSACAPIAVRPELSDAVALMMARLEWEGLFMVELLSDETGHTWFMEINGRAWGSMALARRMGLEYPAWAVASVSGDLAGLPTGVQAAAPRETLTCRHLGRELVHLLLLLRGPRSAAVAPTRGRMAAVLEVLRIRRTDRWYNWRPGEIRFFVDDTLRTVLNVIRARLS